jgi:PKD repeat protein
MLNVIFRPTDLVDYKITSATTSINVTPATSLVAQFTANPITGNAPLTVQFTDASTGS